MSVHNKYCKIQMPSAWFADTSSFYYTRDNAALVGPDEQIRLYQRNIIRFATFSHHAQATILYTSDAISLSQNNRIDRLTMDGWTSSGDFPVYAIIIIVRTFLRIIYNKF